MNTPRKAILTVWCLAVVGSLRLASAEPRLEFVGYAATKAESLFVIRDVDSGAASGWMAVGQSFLSHTIEGFNPQKELLTLKSANRRLELKIQDGRVRHAESQPAAAAVLASQKALKVGGRVRNPISIDPAKLSTLADAIVAAGGLTEDAKGSAVKVTRREADGKVRLYTVDASPNAIGPSSASAFLLRPQDTVFVPAGSHSKK